MNTNQITSNIGGRSNPDGQWPPAWRKTLLGEMGAISGGSTPSTKVPEYWNGSIPWLVPSEVADCDDLFISKTERMITEKGLASCAAKLLPPGTVLMTSRATIGEVVINTVPMATNQGFINIVCSDKQVINEFLAYWIKQNKQVLNDRANGVTFKEITKSNFKNIPIVVPTIPEQGAIASLLRTVELARKVRLREISLERERRVSLMEHLFTCGLSGEPRKQSDVGEIPDSWRVVALGEIGVKTQYGISLRGSQTGTYPMLRMYNLKDGKINTSDLQYVELEPDLLNAFRLTKGDLLFNRTNSYELVGKVSLFELQGDFVFASYLVRLAVDRNQLSPFYLNSYWTLAIFRPFRVEIKSRRR